MSGVRCNLEDLPEHYQAQARAQLGALAARSKDAKPKSDTRMPLEREISPASLLVDPACPLLVRIVRVGGRGLDGDNLAGGCKELRDAIASALGRRGDSDADGMYWEYAQKAGEESGSRIEIYERRES